MLIGVPSMFVCSHTYSRTTVAALYSSFRHAACVQARAKQRSLTAGELQHAGRPARAVKGQNKDEGLRVAAPNAGELDTKRLQLGAYVRELLRRSPQERCQEHAQQAHQAPLYPGVLRSTESGSRDCRVRNRCDTLACHY